MAARTCTACGSPDAASSICSACAAALASWPGSRSATPEQIRAAAAQFVDGGCVCGCDIASPAAHELEWSFEPALSFDQLAAPDVAEWRNFWDAELEFCEQEGRDVEGFIAWWIGGGDAAREGEPIVGFVGPDGRVHLWDGCHRLGLSAVHGLSHVPAFIGRSRAA